MSIQTNNFDFTNFNSDKSDINTDSYQSIKLDDNQIFMIPIGEFTLGKRTPSPRNKSHRYRKH